MRLSLRMSRTEAWQRLRHLALPVCPRAPSSPAWWPACLRCRGASRTDYLAALIASNAELSTLSRNIHRLTALLRQVNVEPARQYREMLDTLAGDVRSHLTLVAGILADLRPRIGACHAIRPCPPPTRMNSPWLKLRTSKVQGQDQLPH